MKDNTSDTSRLMALITSPPPVSAAQLGWIVGELIKREQTPGGPYHIFNNPIQNMRANKKIVAFITRQSYTPDAKQMVTLNYRHQKLLYSRYKRAEEYIGQLPKTLRKPLQSTLGHIRSADSIGEIGLLSTLFTESFIAQNPSAANVAERLDVASILVWVGYTIYDEVFDNRPANTIELVPAATAVLRVAQSLYCQVDCDATASPLLATVDAAIADEYNRNTTQGHTPLSTLRNAMDRKSIAHIAGPLALTARFMPERTASYHAALKKYCAARQLLDDIHDWQDDAAHKQSTYASVRIGQAKTPGDQHTMKRVLMHEVFQMSAAAANTLLNAEKANTFTDITIGRIANIARKALTNDTATAEAIKGYRATLSSKK